MNLLILAALLFTSAIQASALNRSYNDPKPKFGLKGSRPSFCPPTPIIEHQGHEEDEEVEADEPDYSTYNQNVVSSSYFEGSQVDLASAILEYNKAFDLPKVSEDLHSFGKLVQRTASGTFVYFPDHGMILYSAPSSSSVEYVPVVPFYPGAPMDFSIQAAKWITCLKFEEDVEILKREALQILRRL